MLQEATEEDRRGRVYRHHDASGATDSTVKCDVCLLIAKWAAQPASTSRYAYACDQHLACVMSDATAYFVVFPLNRGVAN